MSQGKGSGHCDIKGKEGRKMMLTRGRTRGTWAPPYPKAAVKEGDLCSDRGHRAAVTGKCFESTKEKAS